MENWQKLCTAPKNPRKFHWAPGEIPWNCPKSGGNSERIYLSLLWNSQKLFQRCWKSPDIVHIPWRMARECLWAYWEIPRHFSLLLGNSHRISLIQLRNSQKLFANPWEIPRNCPLVLWNSHRIPLRLLRNSQKLSPTPEQFQKNSSEPTKKFP